MRHRSGRRFHPKLPTNRVTFVSIADDAAGGIEATSYWRTDLAAEGRPYLSTQRFAFRLLLPAALDASLPRMLATALVVVSRGPWPAGDRQDALEFLFDDGQAQPLALRFGMELADRWPPDPEFGAERTLSFWTFDPTGGLLGFGSPRLAGSCRAVYRRVACIAGDEAPGV